MLTHVLKQINTSKDEKLSRKINSPASLILVPTRELAIQVAQVMKPFKKFGLRSMAIYGGQDKEKCVDDMNLNGGVHSIVATPGRLIDFIISKKLSLFKVTYLVIDEADKMVSMGFLDQINMISSQIRPDRQSMMFSATFPGKLREGAEMWIHDAVTIRCNTVEMVREVTSNMREVDESTSSKRRKVDICDDEKMIIPDDTSPIIHEEVSSNSSFTISKNVTQLVHVCATHKKPRLLIKYILRVRDEEKKENCRQLGPMLIFCSKIKTLKFVLDFLQRQNVTSVEGLHGQLPQHQRETILNNFRCGKINTLVATDVASRGLHIKRLKYVVQYDFPSSLEAYCHRVGRAGRGQEIGHSYSLISRNMAPLTRDLIELLESCGQQPEPNLLLLADQFRAGKVEASDDDGGNSDEDD